VRHDPAVRQALVPHLLLQPLVENAIRHAVSQREDGRIEIRARACPADGRLELAVSDNGPGLPAGWRGRPGGIGLENTRARLRALYGAAHRLELESRPGRGLTVHVAVPLREAPASGEAG
jgi:two-component system LytT family sensor kinase